MRYATTVGITIIATAATAGLAAAGSTVTITRLLAEGDPVEGVGNVTAIDAIAVNDSGEWMVEADTDNPDTATDGVVLRSGKLFVREGQALDAPAGASRRTHQLPKSSRYPWVGTAGAPGCRRAVRSAARASRASSA